MAQNLQIGGSLALGDGLQGGETVTFTSAVPLTPRPGPATVINIRGPGGEYLLHHSYRPGVGCLVLNARSANGAWGAEQIVPLAGLFELNQPASWAVRNDTNTGHFVLTFNSGTVVNFQQRFGVNARTVNYAVDDGASLFSNPIKVQVTN